MSEFISSKESSNHNKFRGSFINSRNESSFGEDILLKTDSIKEDEGKQSFNLILYILINLIISGKLSKKSYQSPNGNQNEIFVKSFKSIIDKTELIEKLQMKTSLMRRKTSEFGKSVYFNGVRPRVQLKKESQIFQNIKKIEEDNKLLAENENLKKEINKLKQEKLKVQDICKNLNQENKQIKTRNEYLSPHTGRSSPQSQTLIKTQLDEDRLNMTRSKSRENSKTSSSVINTIKKSVENKTNQEMSSSIKESIKIGSNKEVISEKVNSVEVIGLVVPSNIYSPSESKILSYQNPVNINSSTTLKARKSSTEIIDKLIEWQYTQNNNVSNNCDVDSRLKTEPCSNYDESKFDRGRVRTEERKSSKKIEINISKKRKNTNKLTINEKNNFQKNNPSKCSTTSKKLDEDFHNLNEIFETKNRRCNSNDSEREAKQQSVNYNLAHYVSLNINQPDLNNSQIGSGLIDINNRVMISSSHDESYKHSSILFFFKEKYFNLI